MPDSSPGPLAAADAGLMPQPSFSSMPPTWKGSATAPIPRSSRVRRQALSELCRPVPGRYAMSELCRSDPVGQALSEFLRSLPVIVIAIEALKRLLATVRDRYTELTVVIVGIELETLK